MASTAECSLVVRPPRDRPIATALAPFCPRRIGIGLQDRAFDQDVFKVRRVGQAMEKSFPYTGVRPASKPGMHSCPFAKYLWQVAPARRIVSHPQDRVHKQPVVHAAAAAGPGAAGQITSDLLPLLIRQRASAQGSAPSPASNQKSPRMGIIQMQTRPRGRSAALQGWSPICGLRQY